MVGHVFFWLSYPQAAARPFQWNSWLVAVASSLLHPIPSTHCNGGRFALQVGHLSGNGLGDMGWSAIPYFVMVFFDCMSIKKDFLTVNVLDTLTLQLLVGPRHSIFTSIHCSKQASPGRGMLRCIQGSQGLRCDPPNCWDMLPFELEKQGCA